MACAFKIHHGRTRVNACDPARDDLALRADHAQHRALVWEDGVDIELRGGEVRDLGWHRVRRVGVVRLGDRRLVVHLCPLPRLLLLCFLFFFYLRVEVTNVHFI